LVQQKQNQNNGYLCQHQTAAIAITQWKDKDSVYQYET
jgi:hypothetical protein